MSFLGSYFTYGGVTSHDFDLILVAINGNLNDIPSGSGAEIYTTATSRNPKRLFLGKKENQALEFQVEIVSEKAIDFPTFLRIKQWLFGTSEYQKLQIEEEWYSDFYFNCILKPSEDIKFGGEFFGVRCTVECDSPYAYTFPITRNYVSDNSFSQDFIFDNYSAEIYGLRPLLEFKLTDSGNSFEIKNKTTDRSFSMTNLHENEIITVDNQNQIITSSMGYNRFGNLSKEKNYGYLSFAHGVNQLEFIGYWEYAKLTYQVAVRLGGG